MNRLCKVIILFMLAVTAGSGFAVSESMDQLIADNEIIVPDLEARYPDAEAVIIYDFKEIDQSRTINPVYTTRHVAIKILKESAIDELSTVKIPFYEEIKVTDMDAQVHNGGQVTRVQNIEERDVEIEGRDSDFVIPLEMGNSVYALRPIEIADSPTSTDLLKLTENEIFHKRKDEAFKVREINFPNLQVGSVIEYSYRMEDKRVVIYDRYYFQRKYPVLKAKYVLKNAKMMRFGYQFNNFERKPQTVFEPRFTNIEDHDNMRVRNALRTVDLERPESWQFFGHQYCEIVMDTVEAYPKDTPFIPPFNDVAPRFDFFLSEIINLWMRSDTDYRVRHEYFAPSWNFAISRITKNNLIDEGRSREVKDKVAEVIASASSPEEKVSAAVAWARENIECTGELERWDSYFWMSEPASPDEVMREGKGNADDIAHMLVSGLSLNGLYVYPSYGKSRSRGHFIQEIPVETQFDVSLMALEVGSRRYKFWQPVADVPLPPDYLDHDLEEINMLVNLSGEDDVTFNPGETEKTDAEDNTCQLTATMTLSPDGTVSGSMEQKMTGHLNARLRKGLVKAGAAGQAEAVSGWILGNFGQASLSNVAVQGDLTQPANEIGVSGDLSLSGAGAAGGEGMTIKAALLTDPYSTYLDGTSRQYGLSMPHAAGYTYSVELTVPAGYALPDTIPEPVELRTRGLYYNRVVTKQAADKLSIKREFSFDYLNMPATTYNRRFDKIFEQIQDADDVEIMLKKI